MILYFFFFNVSVYFDFYNYTCEYAVDGQLNLSGSIKIIIIIIHAHLNMFSWCCCWCWRFITLYIRRWISVLNDSSMLLMCRENNGRTSIVLSWDWGDKYSCSKGMRLYLGITVSFINYNLLMGFYELGRWNVEDIFIIFRIPCSWEALSMVSAKVGFFLLKLQMWGSKVKAGIWE